MLGHRAWKVMNRIAVTKGCSYCKNIAAKMTKCGGCHAAYYCNRNCQKSDWSKHKERCGKPNTLGALVKNKVQKNPKTLMILAACASLYCSIHGGNAIQITVHENPNLSFTLNAKTITTMPDQEGKIVLGFRADGAILAVAAEPIGFGFLHLIKEAATRSAHLEVFPEHEPSVYRIVCGAITLDCDV